MGSFTEFVGAFEIRSDAPSEILAIFAPFYDNDHHAFQPIPTLNQDDEDLLDELFTVAYLDHVDLHDVSSVVLAHLWEGSFGDFWPGAFSGAPSTSLRNRNGSWHVTTRTYFKSWADPICSVFAPLARFTCPHAEPDSPTFVGYIRYSGDDRPILIWHDGSESFMYEDTRQRPTAG